MSLTRTGCEEAVPEAPVRIRATALKRPPLEVPVTPPPTAAGSGDKAPASATDLRRRRTRGVAERLVAAAELATPSERALILSIYRDGLSARRVAELRHEPARAVRARLRKVSARLLSARFAFVAQRRNGWPAGRRTIATACVLHGMTLREAAAELGLTFHAVRREMNIVNALFDASPDSAREAP